VLDRGALLRPSRLRGIELTIALFDAAGPPVPGNRGANMVRASTPACCGDFLLRLADCQGKHMIAEAGRATLAPAAPAVAVRERPLARAGAAAFVAVVGVLAAAVFVAGRPLL